MAKKKSGIILNTIVLVIVTLVCVSLLAVVNQITRGPIEQAEINARAEIYKVVYPDADAFAEADNTTEMLEKSAEVMKNAGYEGCFANDVLSVTDADGSVVGYVIAATSPNGYGGDIQVAIGITKDGKLTGFDVISNSETAGLGSKCTEPDFKNQFIGKSASTLEATKSGATADNQIDAISGATITSNAVTEAANAAIVFYQENFAGGVKDKVENVVVDNAEELGDSYKITVTTTKGFAGKITLAVEIGKDSILKSFEIISSNETPGYGAKAQEADYAAKFVGLKADKISFVSTGANKDNNEIDAISGATITTRAVDMAVNEAIKYYQENYGGGLSEAFVNAADEPEESVDAVAAASPQPGEISVLAYGKGE